MLMSFSCANDLVGNCGRNNFSKMFLLRIFLIISISSTALTVNIQNKIIGGVLSENGEFPSMASIQYFGIHICGGNIISDRHVLTAAHCLFWENGTAINTSSLIIMVGRNELRSNSYTPFYTTVNQTKIHPKHKNFDYDIAIIQLNNSLPIGHPNVSIISLGQNPANGTNCTIVGWGHDGQTKIVNNQLRVANVTVMDNKTCYNKHIIEDIIIQPDIICAGDHKSDSCQGDSGGPLICNKSLSGIISSGVGCAHANYPGLYTSVAYHRQWIEENIKNSTKSNGVWIPPILPAPPRPVYNITQTNHTSNGTHKPIAPFPPHPPHVPYPPPKPSGVSTLYSPTLICFLSLLLVNHFN